MVLAADWAVNVTDETREHGVRPSGERRFGRFEVVVGHLVLGLDLPGQLSL